MLSRVVTLLFRLIAYLVVVYGNGIGVMNIQYSVRIQNGEMGKSVGLTDLARGSGSRGPKEGVGAGGREKKEWEPGAVRRRSGSRGP